MPDAHGSLFLSSFVSLGIRHQRSPWTPPPRAPTASEPLCTHFPHHPSAGTAAASIVPAHPRPPCPFWPGTAHLPQDRFVRNTLLSFLSHFILASLCYSTLAAIPTTTLTSTSLPNVSPATGSLPISILREQNVELVVRQSSPDQQQHPHLELIPYANPQTPPQTY